MAFSIDEEYLACLIECIIHGTSEPNEYFRKKIVKTLENRPSIKARISEAKSIDKENRILWQPELERIKNVVLKLARGHMSYELGIQHFEEPDILDIITIPLFTEDQLHSFDSVTEEKNYLFPEIGSRAFINLIRNKPSAYKEWHIVQPGLYRYMVGQSNGNWVKLAISEYLACRVLWI